MITIIMVATIYSTFTVNQAQAALQMMSHLHGDSVGQTALTPILHTEN